MLLSIDPRSQQPIYDQVVRQIKFAIASGVLQPGSMIPSVRELAKELVLNPNTIARAYRELQADGILETVRGVGLRVQSKARRRCVNEQRELIRARLEQMIREASTSSLAREEVEAMIDRELDRFFSPSSSDSTRTK
ncbi:GntR family transcriptional regulator [bacterium]|jgi:GntR family transcriptional regulator|nr:GntR family transcriptional regulator [bacterium]